MTTKRWLVLALWGLMIPAVQVQGGVILTTASVQGGNGNPVPAADGVATLEIQGSNARSYTNSYVVNAGGVVDASIPNLVVDGATQAFGVGLRAIAANVFQNYKGPNNSTVLANVEYGGAAGTTILAVTALGGYVQSVTGTAATGFFSTGSLYLYEVFTTGPGAQQYDPDDPSTWGVFDANGLANTPIAAFTLKPQEDIVEGLPGNPLQGQTLFTADQVNLSIADSSGNGSDGNLLFRQLNPGDPIYPAGGTKMTANTNGEFVSIPTDYPEILFAQYRQSLNRPAALDVGQSDVDFFNAIAAQLGLAAVPGFGGANLFATDVGGANPSSSTAFAPINNGNDPFGIQDIATNFDGIPTNPPEFRQVRPGYEIDQVVPEPSTLHVFMAGAMCLVTCCGVRRRYGANRIT